MSGFIIPAGMRLTGEWLVLTMMRRERCATMTRLETQREIPMTRERSANPPNVLLFITDQQRWDTLGYTGRTPCRTPNLDRLARAGVAFDRCITPDPICSPARAALFTGRYPHATGVGNNRETPLMRPAAPEVFRDAGYHVAYAGKWHLGRDRATAGFHAFAGERGREYKTWLAKHGFLDTYPYGTDEFSYHFEGSEKGRISNPRTAAQEGSTETIFDSWVASRALEQLETRPKDRPFFHVCSFHGPHPIFVIPEPYYSLFDPAEAAEPANFGDPMDGKPAFQTRSIWHGAARSHGTAWDAWRRSQSVYWGYVTMLDELIGRVLLRLEALGLAENTIVVMTADHGEQMGSHGLFQKSCMYEEALRVPCIVRAPGLVPPGRRVTAPVSLADITPTLLGLTGLTAPGSDLLQPQGRDLSGWLTGDQTVPAASVGATDDPAAGAVFSEYKPYEGEGMTDIRCIVGPRYKYAWNRDDRAELYDTWADPGELTNRADDPALGPIRQRLQERLLEWMRLTADPLLDVVTEAMTRRL
jgi:arylsulfatase A-like enzyme